MLLSGSHVKLNFRLMNNKTPQPTNDYASLTDQVEESDKSLDRICVATQADNAVAQRMSAENAEVRFATLLVKATHDRAPTQPYYKPKLYYTGTEIQNFKREARTQGRSTLQSQMAWEKDQKLTRLRTIWKQGANPQIAPCTPSSPVAPQVAPPTHALMDAQTADTHTHLGPMSEEELNKGVLNGSIPSAAYDTACTSHSGMPGNPFIQTNTLSKNVFALADNYPIPGSNVANLHYDVRKTARTVDMVPSLTKNSLLSGEKLHKRVHISMRRQGGKPVRRAHGENIYFQGGRAQRVEIPQGKPVAHSSS